MFKCRHRSCGYFTFSYIPDSKWWLSHGLWYHTNVFNPPRFICENPRS